MVLDLVHEMGCQLCSWMQKAQPLPNLASWSIFSPFPSHAMGFPNCFVKALFGKFPLKMMQKLCADMYPVSPLPCDAGAPSEFHWLLNLAAAPRPPPSSPFSCKWRLPNTGGEDTGIGCESVQERLRLSLCLSPVFPCN